MFEARNASRASPLTYDNMTSRDVMNRPTGLDDTITASLLSKRENIRSERSGDQPIYTAQNRPINL